MPTHHLKIQCKQLIT